MQDSNGALAIHWRVLLWSGGSLWIGQGGIGQAHAHHAIQISVALSGRMRLRDGPKGTWREYAGAIVLPHQHHQFDSSEASAANIFVEPETILGRALLKRFDGQAIGDLSSELVEREQAPLVAHLREAHAGAAADSVLIAASRRLAECLSGATPPALQVDPRITRVIEHLRANLGNPISLTEAAAIAHLSPSRFRHLFIAQTGASFRVYLLWARIEAAVGAAMTGRSWTEVAHELGFADSAHLSRTCKRMFGISPSMLIRN
ncbi:MAG: helix-turn-helix transcriptional regulator [Betaproteobacteria bacterium]|nr:helix-turn-helix transcriptional regulator [Betaproteobacteria bacterium]